MPATNSYELRDAGLLRQLMEHPGRGHRFSLRELASLVDRHKSWLGKLTQSKIHAIPEHVAKQIATALGVELLVLFLPSPSTNLDDKSKDLEQAHGHHRTQSADATCIPPELGEHQ